jgi:hypothetical protein
MSHSQPLPLYANIPIYPLLPHQTPPSPHFHHLPSPSQKECSTRERNIPPSSRTFYHHMEYGGRFQHLPECSSKTKNQPEHSNIFQNVLSKQGTYWNIPTLSGMFFQSKEPTGTFQHLPECSSKVKKLPEHSEIFRNILPK